MRDEKKLEGKDWMHVLGTSQLDWACYLTGVQRQVREHINPNFTISFDSASAFLSTANGLVYTQNMFTPSRWSFIMDKAPDDKKLKGSNIPFPFQSAIGDRLKMGDVCWYGEGDLNKNGKLDTNFIGIPKEEFGNSNNIQPNFGPPKFEDMIFKIENDMLLKMTAQSLNL